MKKISKLALPIFIAALLLVIFSSIIINNKGIYIMPGDSLEQMYQFYLGGWQRFHTGTLTQFDWSLGVGGNVLSYVYYFLTSPFFYITLLFPRELIKNLFLYLNLIKIFLLFFTTYYWLCQLTPYKKSRLIGSFMVAFSGWVFFYYAYNMFLDAFLIFPIILGLIEVYLRKGKFTLLVLTIGFLGIVNYYFLYIFVPFGCLYTLIRYLDIHRVNLAWKKTLIDGLKFVGLFLLGIGLSSMILIPCAYLISTNGRFSQSAVSLFTMTGINELTYFFSTVFLPVFERLNASYLIPISTHQFIGWGGGCSLFAFILTPLLLPLLFVLKDKFKKKLYLATYALLFIFLLFQFTWILLQRSLDTRWFYMFLFLNVLSVTTISEELEEKKIKGKYLWLSLSLVGVVVCCFLANMVFQRYMLRQQMLEVGIVAAFFLIVGFLYVLYFNSKKKNTIFLIAILSMEALGTGLVFVTYNYAIDHTYFEQPEHSTKAIDYLKSVDQGYYRVLYGSESYQIDGAPSAFMITTANEPFSKNYAGFTFYNTVYNTETDDYYNRSRSNWLVSEMMGRNKLYNLLSAKYWITYDFETQIPDYYEEFYHDEVEGYTIYKNPYFIELGKTYTKTINQDYFNTLPTLEQDRLVLDYYVSESSDNTTYQLDQELISLGQLPDEEYRELVLEEPLEKGNLYIVNYGIPSIYVSLYMDDQLVTKREYSQFNYVDLVIDEPINKIVVEGSNDSGVPAFMEVYFEPETNWYPNWYQAAQEEAFTNVKKQGDTISAEIEIKESAKSVFTSIPYDKGWKVVVNNQRIEIEKASLGFIGFRLEPGKYEVRFEYSIPYLGIGLGISGLSLFILFGLNWVKNNSKRKK